jgi:hypothetical protein
VVQDQPRLTELTLSRIWQDGRFARELRTTDGQSLAIVYRGVWTHSNGPDFRDAMIDLSGRLRRGAIELHLRASDWQRHGHPDDPAYDEVILHVVLDDDLSEPVQTRNGTSLPTLVLRSYLSSSLEELSREVFATELGVLGSETCLPMLCNDQPTLIHDTLRREGWRRMAAKQLRFAQDMEHLPPGETLYRGLLDALGLTHNRAGMAAIADRLPLSVVEATQPRHLDAALALLLGVGGFMPLSPAHASTAEISPDFGEGIERLSTQLLQDLRLEPVASSIWSLNRVRPANHPVRRLASFANLLRSCSRDGLLSTVLDQTIDRPECWRTWLESARPAVGRSRADQIAVNVLAPFLAAYAEIVGDQTMSERVARMWEVLPGQADDTIAKGTLRQIVGDARFPIRLAIEAQGLHQIGRSGCADLRCFECPIAALAVMHEPRHRQQISPTDREVTA